MWITSPKNMFKGNEQYNKREKQKESIFIHAKTPYTKFQVPM